MEQVGSSTTGANDYATAEDCCVLKKTKCVLHEQKPTCVQM